MGRIPAWLASIDRTVPSASTGSPTTRYSSVRLHVEIATASWTSPEPRRSRRKSAARAAGSASRSRTSTGAVLCETPIASSSLISLPR